MTLGDPELVKGQILSKFCSTSHFWETTTAKHVVNLALMRALVMTSVVLRRVRNRQSIIIIIIIIIIKRIDP